MNNWIPVLTDVKNEIVFYLAVLSSIILGVMEVVEGWDVDSVSSWAVILPAIGGVIGRRFAFGPLTVSRMYKPKGE